MNVERSSHPSSVQIEALLEFLEKYPDLAKGFSKTKNARERNQRLWQQLSVRLNSMGGAIKSYKQWTKYWADKKSAIRKKVAAQGAARRRTGGGVEDVELSEVEERIVALFGGAGFGTGDTHLGIQPFPETVSQTTPEQQRADIQPRNLNIACNSPVLELRSSSEATEILRVVLTPDQHQYEPTQTVRRLFVDSEDIFSSEPNQSNQLGSHQEQCSYPSPPPPTLSHTPSPLPLPATSRSGCGGRFTTSTSHMVRGSASGEIGFSSSCHAEPATLLQSSTPASVTVASPSRRGATLVNTSSLSGRGSRGAVPSSCHAEPATPLQSSTPASITVASPSRRGATLVNTSSRGSRGGTVPSSRTRPAITPSQRRTEFSRITERFLVVEEQQLDIQRSNARVLQTMVEQSIQRDNALAEAVAAVGEGLKVLAEAIRRNQSQ